MTQQNTPKRGSKEARERAWVNAKFALDAVIEVVEDAGRLTSATDTQVEWFRACLEEASRVVLPHGMVLSLTAHQKVTTENDPFPDHVEVFGEMVHVAEIIG